MSKKLALYIKIYDRAEENGFDAETLRR